MLQTAALEAWDHPKAQGFRDKIDFTGVFVPTDVGWNEQLNSIGEGFLEESHRKRLGDAAFIAHVHHALVKAMVCRVSRYKQQSKYHHRRVTISEKIESHIVKGIATAWNIESSIPSLISLKHSLRMRIADIWTFAQAEEFLPLGQRQRRFHAQGFFKPELMSSIASAVEMFNDGINDSEGRWAFLFDELELAPERIIKQIRDSIRSIDDRILFKLSLSPFSSQQLQAKSPLSASSGNDFQTIQLWYTHKREGYPFCSELLKGMLQDKNLQETDPEKIFGSSIFQGIDDESDEIKPYEAGSFQHRLLVKMAKSDRSFKQYVESRKIDLSRIGDLKESNRASLIRKIIPTLIVREAYRTRDSLRKSGVKQLKIRSRKLPKIYSGIPSIYALTEGNPRWLIGIASNLLDARINSSKVSSTAQETEFLLAAERFISMLRIIPCTDGPEGGRLTDVLDKIGEFIFKSVVLDEFSPQPYGELSVDRSCPQSLVNALGIALNSGAIVYIPPNKNTGTITDLRGKTFRLSYLLSPYYGIPIRKGEKISLSRIMNLSQSLDIKSVSSGDWKQLLMRL